MPLGLIFGTLFLKNRDLEAASTFDLIFPAFGQSPGLPFEVIFNTFSLKNVILKRVGLQAAVSAFFVIFGKGGPSIRSRLRSRNACQHLARKTSFEQDFAPF